MILHGIGSLWVGDVYKTMSDPVEHDEPGFLSPGLERVPF